VSVCRVASGVGVSGASGCVGNGLRPQLLVASGVGVSGCVLSNGLHRVSVCQVASGIWLCWVFWVVLGCAKCSGLRRVASGILGFVGYFVLCQGAGMG